MGACCQNGSPATPSNDVEQTPVEDEPKIWKIGAGLLLAGNAMSVGLAISSVDAAPNITLFIHIALLASVVIVFELLGWPLARGAWEGLRQWQINFVLFFLIAIIAAVAASMVSMISGQGPVYFEVAALLLVIHGIGRRVGNVRRRRGLAHARSWMPDDTLARRLRDDGIVESVAVDELQTGDCVIVGPGDIVPVDGTVSAGTALVRDTELSGESFASARRPGDTVYAGSHSIDGRLEIRTTSPRGQRLIDRVLTSVEEAWQRPSRWQTMARRIIRWFVPLVLATTVATFVFWTLTVHWSTGLFYALAVLLVACPCALGFAVPLTVWITMGKWAGRGLVAAHGQCVETISRVDTVVFDKTGTLTEPTPGVVDFVAQSSRFDVDDLRQMIVAVEEQIDHPVARALSRLKKDLPSPCCLPPLKVQTTRLIPGLGIEARIRLRDTLHTIRLGPPRLMERFDVDARTTLAQLESQAHIPETARSTVVIVDGQLAALAIVDERPRGWVEEGLCRLKSMGLEVGLMTGDSAHRARSFDLDWTMAEMTPVEKRDEIRRLQERGRTVLFVGDGVNDAAAMAASDVAINVADSAELAAEMGDIRWRGDDLRTLADAIALGRRAFATVRFNLRFATFYNVAGISIAAAGLLHPVVAAILMMSSSFFVTWHTTHRLEEASHSEQEGSAPGARAQPGRIAGCQSELCRADRRMTSPPH